MTSQFVPSKEQTIPFPDEPEREEEVNHEARLFKVVNAENDKLVMIAPYTTISGVFAFHYMATIRMLKETSLEEYNFCCHMHMNGRKGVPCDQITVTEWKGQI